MNPRFDTPAVPTPETLPVPESIPFTHREGVHIPHRYRKTAFPMKVSAPRETQAPADTVVQTKTKVIGKEKRTRGHEWKVPKTTAKTERKRRRADKWLKKQGHLI